MHPAATIEISRTVDEERDHVMIPEPLDVDRIWDGIACGPGELEMRASRTNSAESTTS